MEKFLNNEIEHQNFDILNYSSLSEFLYFHCMYVSSMSEQQWSVTVSIEWKTYLIQISDYGKNFRWFYSLFQT